MYRYRKHIPIHKNNIDNFTFNKHDLVNALSILVPPCGGPGDEVRFASLYTDIIAFNTGLVSFLCDIRLQKLLQNSFKDVNFIPSGRSHLVKISNGIREPMPLSTTNHLPHMKLSEIFDNNSFDNPWPQLTWHNEIA